MGPPDKPSGSTPTKQEEEQQPPTIQPSTKSAPTEQPPSKEPPTTQPLATTPPPIKTEFIFTEDGKPVVQKNSFQPATGVLGKLTFI